MAQMDMELKKAFAEMQINKLETTKKLKMIDMKCDMVKRGKRKYLLTEKATNDLTDETKVYMPIGRMFLLTDLDGIRAELKNKQERCDKTIMLYKNKKEYLIKSLKDQEDGLRELVQQRKEADTTAK